MGLLDSILGAVSGKGDTSEKAAPLIGVLSGLLTQCGGLEGLASKFSQSGQGNAFSSWVGLGENQSVSTNQIQEALGSDQIRALAGRLGVDPAMASNFLAEYLPKIVDKLTTRWKDRSCRGSSTGVNCFVAITLAKPRWETWRRSVGTSAEHFAQGAPDRTSS